MWENTKLSSKTANCSTTDRCSQYQGPRKTISTSDSIQSYKRYNNIPAYYNVNKILLGVVVHQSTNDAFSLLVPSTELTILGPTDCIKIRYFIYIFFFFWRFCWPEYLTIPMIPGFSYSVIYSVIHLHHIQKQHTWDVNTW